MGESLPPGLSRPSRVFGTPPSSGGAPATPHYRRRLKPTHLDLSLGTCRFPVVKAKPDRALRAVSPVFRADAPLVQTG